jgi:MFS family permease
MTDTSLRKGLGMGVLAAVIGLAALFVGSWFEPRTNPTTVDLEVQYFIIAGLLAFFALAAVLGLAYFAGMRTARDHSDEPSWSFGDTRREAAWSGAIVVAAYWLATTLAMLLTPHHNGSTPSDIAGRQLVAGVVFILFGYALGAVGGRALAARNLLSEISARPRTSPDRVTPTSGEPPSSSGDPH